MTPLSLLLLATVLADPPRDVPAEPQKFVFARMEMGMKFEIMLYARDEAQAKAAAQAAFQRIHDLNAIFSDYDSASELSKLSATAGGGMPVKVSSELWQVLWYGQQVARQTEGAFDMSVGPVVKLWRRARRTGRLPAEQTLAAALGAVGYENLVLDEAAKTAELRARGMRLDLGGIAVGYAIDDALRVLKEHGIVSALVDGSGDIVMSDPPPGKEGWKIGIAPLQPDAPPSVFLALHNCAISTSGDAFQHVTINGRRYSHIVDPRTGLGLTTPCSVTVAAPTGMAADAWATALSVLGPEKGLTVIDKQPGLAAYVVRQEGENAATYASRRWADLKPSEK